jgi:hypothetical protein
MYGERHPERPTRSRWPFVLLFLSLACTIGGMLLSQRAAMLSQQAVQRTLQIQQQQLQRGSPR